MNEQYEKLPASEALGSAHAEWLEARKHDSEYMQNRQNLLDNPDSSLGEFILRFERSMACRTEDEGKEFAAKLYEAMQASEAEVKEQDAFAQEMENRRAWDRAIHECEAASAIQYLGNLLQLSKEHGGFEGIQKDHWYAVGIAIENLGRYLSEGSLAENLNEVGTILPSENQ